MIDKEDRIVLIADLDECMSEIYWRYRDDLTDEGGEKMLEELSYLNSKMISILEKYPA